MAKRLRRMVHIDTSHDQNLGRCWRKVYLMPKTKGL